MIAPEPVTLRQVERARLARRYEELRDAVLARPRLPGTGQGEAVVVRRGLAAWIALPATGDETPPRRAARERHETMPLPAVVHEQLLSVLVNLVLGGSVPQESRR